MNKRQPWVFLTVVVLISIFIGIGIAQIDFKKMFNKNYTYKWGYKNKVGQTIAYINLSNPEDGTLMMGLRNDGVVVWKAVPSVVKESESIEQLNGSKLEESINGKEKIQ